MSKKPEGRRILVVEDEALVAMLVQDMLAALGHSVVGPVATVADALAAVERESFDAALLDINLDGDEVYPVAEALADKAVPFAFVTGYDNAGVSAEWRNRPLLEKPFRQGELERFLNTLLRFEPRP